MATILLGLALSPVLSSDLGAAAFAELRYSGIVAPLTRDGERAPAKRFDVYCLLRRPEDQSCKIGFLVDERGAGAWAWPERFGMLELDAENQPQGPGRIQVLHEHDNTLYPLPVPQPLFRYDGKLQPEATWRVRGDTYRVIGTLEVAERDCWQVQVSANISGRPKQTIAIDRASGLIVASETRIFMGRGDEFVLRVQLDSAEELQKQEFEQIFRPLSTLVELQRELKRAAGETRPQLSEVQLQAAKAALVQLVQEAETTPFRRLVAVISRDVQTQMQRSDDVAGLAKKFVGRPAPEISLVDLNNQAIDPAQHADKIVVLHFWKYHDDPLVEPYGQVGYVDFLHSRRSKLGVRVYGVAVDERLSDPTQRSTAVRQVKKFREFMNLAYAVTLDDGSLLEKLGDPRRVGAMLPLYVVIDADGNIAHYHAGYYDVDSDEGLRELDEVVVGLIKKQRQQD